jgi:hypothetical protein
MSQLLYYDRIKETTSIEDSGAYTLDGAVAGFGDFVTVIPTGSYIYYCAEDGTDWETGVGFFNDSSAIERHIILDSSNGAGSPVTWSAGDKNIYLTKPANAMRQVEVDDQAPSGSVRVDSDGVLRAHNITGSNFVEKVDVDYTMTAGEFVSISATGDIRTVTLPASPNNGEICTIAAWLVPYKVIIDAGTITINLPEVNNQTTVDLFLTKDIVSLQYDAGRNRWWLARDGRHPIVGHMLATSVQTISNGVWTYLNYNSTIISEGGVADLSNERFNIPRTGFYYLETQVAPENLTLVAGDRILSDLYVNGWGSHGWQDVDVGGDRFHSQYSKVLYMTAGQYVQAKVYFFTGGNCDTEANYTNFYIHEVR